MIRPCRSPGREWTYSSKAAAPLLPTSRASVAEYNFTERPYANDPPVRQERSSPRTPADTSRNGGGDRRSIRRPDSLFVGRAAGPRSKTNSGPLRDPLRTLHSRASYDGSTSTAIHTVVSAYYDNVDLLLGRLGPKENLSGSDGIFQRSITPTASRSISRRPWRSGRPVHPRPCRRDTDGLLGHKTVLVHGRGPAAEGSTSALVQLPHGAPLPAQDSVNLTIRRTDRVRVILYRRPARRRRACLERTRRK